MDKELVELKNRNFMFKKQFGQNFITDKNLLNAICCDASINMDDNVLEIGVGAGTLTEALGKHAQKVIGIEIDKTLKEFLQEKFNNTNVNIIINDFLKVNSEDINNLFNGDKFKVVANLPYYITTPIIFKLIEENFNVKSITVMVQKEVADRLCAKPDSKDYGIISIILNAVADVNIKRIIKRDKFIPEPNVDSALVHFEINKSKYKINNFVLFQKIVKQSFSMRRKTLFNNLKYMLDIDKIQQAYKVLNLDMNVRAENLSVEQFVLLSNIML